MAAGSRLQVQLMDFFFFHLLFKHALFSQVKGFRPHGLLVYRLCLPSDTPIIFKFLFINFILYSVIIALFCSHAPVGVVASHLLLAQLIYWWILLINL